MLLERGGERLAAAAETAVVQGDRHGGRERLAAHGVLAADWHDLDAQVVGLRLRMEGARAGLDVELGARRRRHGRALAVVVGEAHLRSRADLELPARLLADGAEVAVARELEEDAVPGRERAATVQLEDRTAERGPGPPVALDLQDLHLGPSR